MSYYSKKYSLGVALGGGGARALAHIGVLKGLEMEGFHIDYLAGSSMGGFLAAAYATGVTAIELEAEAMRVTRLEQLMRLVDPSSARRGLLEGGKVRQYLTGLLGKDMDFSRLPIRLALTAVDLPTGEEVVLTEGSLVEAAMATVAVPGLFPEVRLGSYELIDGGRAQ